MGLTVVADFWHMVPGKTQPLLTFKMADRNISWNRLEMTVERIKGFFCLGYFWI